MSRNTMVEYKMKQLSLDKMGFRNIDPEKIAENRRKTKAKNKQKKHMRKVGG